jgi:hypothetical protein
LTTADLGSRAATGGILPNLPPRGLLALSAGGTSISSANLSPAKVVVVRSNGTTQERAIGAFPGAKRFDRLKVSPGRTYASWDVSYAEPDETYDVPLEVYIVGGFTALEINNGFAVRDWKFLSDRKVEVCTGAIHGDSHNRCDVYLLPK